MKTCMVFSTLTLFLIIKFLQIQCLPIHNSDEPYTPEELEQSQRSKFVDDVTKQLLHAVEKLKDSKKDPVKRFRQEDEDDDELPELVPGILKIVGSALAGNASALIDSSISLIPEDVHSSISGALNVLVNSINSARPTKAPVRAPVKVSNTSASPLKSTTEEDEEDDEDKTDLRTNSSASSNITTTISTIKINDSEPTTELFALPLSQTTPTTALPPPFLTPAHRTNPPTTRSPVSFAAPKIPTVDSTMNSINFGGEPFDSDNKANWMSLVDNNIKQQHSSSLSETFANPMNEIDDDNRANWISLIGSGGNVESSNLNVNVKNPSDATNKQNNQNSEILVSSKFSVTPPNQILAHYTYKVPERPSRPSHLNANNNPQKPQSFFSLSIRDNSKAPGQKLSHFAQNYPSNQPEVIIPGAPSSASSSSSSYSLGNKLTAVLLSRPKPINSFIGEKLSEQETDGDEQENIKIQQLAPTPISTSAPVVFVDSRPDPTPNTSNNNNNSNSQELSSEEDEKEKEQQVSTSPSSPVSKSTENVPYSNYADKFSYGKGNGTTSTSEPQLNTESTTVDDDDEEEDEDSK